MGFPPRRVYGIARISAIQGWDMKWSGLRATRSHRGEKRVPTVIFLDEMKWEAFFQLAAKIRKNGVRCVRVTSVPQKASRLVSRLIFADCVYLTTSKQEEILRSVLRSENVVDLQFSENYTELVQRCSTELPPTLVEEIVKRVALMDKVASLELMQRAGVPTPARISLSSPEVDCFIQTHGLPVVLKNRFGYGGSGVTVFSDRVALFDQIQSIGDAVDEYFIEAYVEGVRMNYGAAVVNGSVAQESCYATTKSANPLGPSTQIETVRSDEVLLLGRRIVLASTCNGLMNINFMQDKDGTCWPVDFNLRTFGKVTSFQKAGLDFREGYLRSLGMETPVTASQARVGVTLDSYPEAQRTLIREHHLFKGLAGVLAKAPENARSVSWRYTALEVLALITMTYEGRRQPSSSPEIPDQK
jgi:hypothetical protein